MTSAEGPLRFQVFRARATREGTESPIGSRQRRFAEGRHCPHVELSSTRRSRQGRLLTMKPCGRWH